MVTDSFAQVYTRRTKKVLAIVLAGGEGKRLMPLTGQRAKPAVPFGGTYRLIDFPLSNLVNSGYRRIIVLTQYKSHSLDRHIARAWPQSMISGDYVAPVPAQQMKGDHWYLGSADAIYQSIPMIMDENPDIIVIVGADHVYRMDFWQMVDAHIESGAEFTVSAIRQPISLADQMGVIDIDKENPGKIRAFLEKPKNPEGLPDSPNEVLASMGNYVANADALLSALGKDAVNKDSKHDMGGDIVPYFVERGTAGVYDFKDNEVPGSFAIDRSYWRDVGTIDQYYEANLDLVDFEPRFNLYNRSWPLLTAYESLPPAKFVHSEPKRRGRAMNSIVSPGVIVSGAHFEHCIISSGVRAHSWATVNNSIIFNDCYISRSANIQNTILDKSVYVGEGAQIGVDRERDLTRGFTITETGITVVPKNAIVFK